MDNQLAMEAKIAEAERLREEILNDRQQVRLLLLFLLVFWLRIRLMQIGRY